MRVFVCQLLEGGIVRALVYLELISLELLSALDDLLTIVKARSNLLVVRAKLGWCCPSTRGTFAKAGAVSGILALPRCLQSCSPRQLQPGHDRRTSPRHMWKTARGTTIPSRP